MKAKYFWMYPRIELERIDIRKYRIEEIITDAKLRVSRKTSALGQGLPVPLDVSEASFELLSEFRFRLLPIDRFF